MPTFAIVPTYNEAENLPRLVEDLLNLPVTVNVIVVDDNSPDGTGALADGLAASNPGRVHAIHRAGKLGLGTAYIAGFHRAFELGARNVLTMDADFSHHPRYIPAMVHRLTAADLVIGSRYTPGGGTRNCPPHRKLLSRGANAVAKGMLGLHAGDTTAGFRLYRREVLEAIPLNQILSSGYSFLIEMLFVVERSGWRVAEVPIVFEDRMAGVSKISKHEIFKALATVWRLSGRRMVEKLDGTRARQKRVGQW